MKQNELQHKRWCLLKLFDRGCRMFRISKVLIFMFFLYFAFGGTSKVFGEGITLTVERTTITMDDEISVEVTIEGNFSDYTPPSGDCFTLTQGSQSTQISIINGVTTKYAKFGYVLVPNRVGKCKVGPAYAWINGRRVASNSVVITIKKGIESSPITKEKLKQLRSMSGKPFFIIPVLPQKNIYVGEPFVAGYNLYIRANIPVSNANITKQPNFNGFITFDLLGGKIPKGKRKKIGSYIYYEYPMVRNILIPLKAGKVTIPSLTVAVFIDDFFNPRKYKVKSNPVVFEIKNIPTDQAPEGYDGSTVGQYDISSKISKTDVKVGENIVLSFIIKGTGNIEGIPFPEIPAISGVEISRLPSQSNDKIEKDFSGIHGTRTFDFLIVPKRAGSFVIPAIKFVYFDPYQEKFVVKKTESYTIKVKGSSPGAGSIQVSSGGGSANFSLPDFLQLETKAGTVHKKQKQNVYELIIKIFFSLLFLAVLGSEISLFVKRFKKSHEKEFSKKKSYKKLLKILSDKSLKNMDKKKLKSTLFLGISEFFLHNFNINIKEISIEEGSRLLREKGFGEDVALKFEKVMNSIESLPYSPEFSDKEQIEKLILEIKGFINSLNGGKK